MRIVRVALALSLAATLAVAQHHAGGDRTGVDSRAPMLDDIGNHSYKVSTANKLAQRYFDQGLTMLYGFNHLEAERSFAQAAKEDPNLAMAYWGHSYSLGSNINDAITPAREAKAIEALGHAQHLKANATPAERALIEALASRYSKDPKADRAALNASFMKAMEKAAAQFPDDPEVQTIYADSIMNTMPWDYYVKDGSPKPDTAKLITTLEGVLKQHPKHPGAHHLYIHAVEASPAPDRGVPSAEELLSLVPAAGHLVHMPSHIFMRVGRYSDASRAGELAVAADDSYITQCNRQGIYPLGYHPHNWHMLAFSSMFEGRKQRALEAADRTLKAVKDRTAKDGLPPWGNVFSAIPVFAMVRFGEWKEVLAYPKPKNDVPFTVAVWHYGRGVAYARTNQPANAERERAALKRAAADPRLKDFLAGANPAASLLKLAHLVLQGEIAASRKQYGKAVTHLEQAVAIQDGLTYNEPEDWYYPVRQSLGAVLMKANRPADAERVYRTDLKRYRNNGWSLFGLAQSLRAQGKKEEAAEIDQQFQKAWQRADVKLTASVF